MASPKSPKDKFLVNVINPYLAEVNRHPQTLWVEDGVLHKEDLKGPIKERNTRARLEEVEILETEESCVEGGPLPWKRFTKDYLRIKNKDEE
ncbi:40S ribosomal protein S5-1 [Hordeum vulgare]|nr:40S ribosomal protein S5-1 [Hordeum vulgare]